MLPNWNSDITLYLRHETETSVQWERRCFSRCFFKRIKSSALDDKSRIEGEGFTVRIPCKEAFEIPEGSFAVLKREHCISKIRKRGILAATEECLLAAMALNLKRMVNAVFFYLQISCSARPAAGFGRIFAFVNRSRVMRKFVCRLWLNEVSRQ